MAMNCPRSPLSLLAVAAFAAAATAVAATAQGPTTLVVPSTAGTADASAYGWLAGASRPVRQQTLIGASHLQPIVGRAIRAIEFRRHAAAEPYQGGTAHLTLSLSTAPHAPIEASPTFAANVGPSPVTVFSGNVSFPTSPAPIAGQVPWTADNLVRIEFTTPFAYSGGPLCLDLIGTPVAGQNASWWMADLELEDLAGTTVDLGGGCGLYGGSQKRWSHVARRSLLPGAHARFSAFGTPFGLGIAAFGQKAPIGVPLSLLGFPSGVGCDLHLATIDALLPAVFLPPAEPADFSFGGEAEVAFMVPAVPAVYGVTMTTQWLDWSQMATSNAVEWTIASAMPGIDMALVEGHAAEAAGLAAVYMGHVLRFEVE
jgi:hypothetical protein